MSASVQQRLDGGYPPVTVHGFVDDATGRIYVTTGVTGWPLCEEYTVAADDPDLLRAWLSDLTAAVEAVAAAWDVRQKARAAQRTLDEVTA